MKRFFLFFIYCWLLTGAVCIAQVQTAAPAGKTIKTDTAKVVFHQIDKAELKRLKADPDFTYTETPPAQLSLWDRFWIWFWGLINKAIGYSVSNPILKYGFIGLGIALVLYVTYRLIRSDKIFTGSGTKNILDYDVYPDDIHNIDYEKELATAVNEGKYRLAIRLLYLRSLKKLSDKNIITWRPDKTNYAYVNEVKREDLQQHFKALTLQFDYIWYGYFPLEMQDFKPLQQSFNDFNAMIR